MLTQVLKKLGKTSKLKVTEGFDAKIVLNQDSIKATPAGGSPADMLEL